MSAQTKIVEIPKWEIDEILEVKFMSSDSIEQWWMPATVETINSYGIVVRYFDNVGDAHRLAIAVDDVRLRKYGNYVRDRK